MISRTCSTSNSEPGLWPRETSEFCGRNSDFNSPPNITFAQPLRIAQPGEIAMALRLSRPTSPPTNFCVQCLATSPTIATTFWRLALHCELAELFVIVSLELENVIDLDYMVPSTTSRRLVTERSHINIRRRAILAHLPSRGGHQFLLVLSNQSPNSSNNDANKSAV